MKIHELMERIGFPENAKEEVLKYRLEENKYSNWRELFYRDTDLFLKEWKESEDHLQWILAFYLQLACEVYEEYQRQNICEDIFDASFKDITLWGKECYRKYNCWGLEEAYWIGKTMKMELFRLGRLQFEPIQLKENLDSENVHLKEGDYVLNVHIPADGKMDYEECLKSFTWSKTFFDKKYKAYMCDSWLISPMLKELLPSETNIVKFMNLYEIVRVNYDTEQPEIRIFQDVRADKENYPEDSLLRRKTKPIFMEGKNTGSGIGVFYR